MRKEFAELLMHEMQTNTRIRVLTADLGFGIFDNLREQYSSRFFNVGAAEQLMIGMGIGMAENNLIPICYSMSTFLLYRPFEFLRNYVNYEKIPVKLVGSGRDKDYIHDGISHWAHDDEDVLRSLPNIKIYKPKSITELNHMFPEFINNTEPGYLNLTRKI